jgi:EmrB/QacA subfamily drug resistance transporter
MLYQATNQIIGQRRWLALSAVMVTLFFSSLDQTVVTTALPTIIGELNGLASYAWVFTAYMMTAAITVPLYGKLSDVYGRKPFYLFGLGVFILGSALAGFSRSMEWLIAARALQGIGGGGMMSMPRATVGDIFNPKERGKWIGLLNAVFGLSAIIGPYLGGWITDTLGWRWIFYINLPVALLAFIAVAFALPNVRTATKHRIDWFGSGTLMAGLIPILLGFTWAGSKYGWGSPQILALFAVGFVVIVAFVFVEKRADEPILNPNLFRNRIFTTTVLMSFFLAVGMYSGLMFLPIFVQGVVGLSATNSGAILTPMMLSFIFGSTVGGILVSRLGRYKLQAIIGALIMVGGIFLLEQMDVQTTWGLVVRNMMVVGLAMGAVMPLANVVIQNAFPYSQMGVVNSTQQFVTSLGGIISSPIFGTILSNTFNTSLKKELPAPLVAQMDMMPDRIKSVLSNPQALIDAKAQNALKAMFGKYGSAGDALYAQFMKAVKSSLAQGVQRLFLFGLIFAGLTLVSALLLKEIKLKRDEFYKEPPGEPSKKEIDGVGA